MEWLQYGIVFAVVCVVTIALVPPVKKLAFKLDAVDYPAERRVNKVPIPRMGGLAMFGGLAAGMAVLLFGITVLDWIFPFRSEVSRNLWYPGVGLGLTIVFLVGVIDDIINLKPIIKLIGQVVAAVVIAASGLLITNIGHPFVSDAGSIILGWLSFPITVIYLVAFTNIINLIDGLDGLASGITAIASATMLAFAILTYRVDAAFMAVALVGACVGFLRYNRHPASVFMGDSGSLLLGMSLGVVSIFATTRSALLVSLIVPIIVAGVPVIDTASAIIRRIRAGQPIQQADRGHIHHRLLDEGYDQQAVVFIMWGWTLVLAISAIFITQMHGVARLPFIVLALGVSIFFVIKLNLLGSVLQHHYAHRPSTGQKRAREEFNKASGPVAGRSDAAPDESNGAKAAPRGRS